MTDDDCGEIEYLDEDEDLVHQCVQNLSENHDKSFVDLIPITKTPTDPLLKERKAETKRKVKSEDDDSDYDPNIDMMLQRKKRTKINFNKKPTLFKVESEPTNKMTFRTTLDRNKYKPTSNTRQKSQIDLPLRKNAKIKIPNYEDALCLPGKAFKRDENDVKRLKNWNRLCLERLKRNDNVLRTEYGSVVKSSRSFVFRNVQNPNGGRVETSIWCKSSVENEAANKRSEIFQTVIPYFREKNLVRPYQLMKAPRSNNMNKFEFILTTEKSKDEEYLVAYNTKDCLSAVYKSFMIQNMDTEIDDKDNRRICLKETTCCKVCAPCYQVSWRGVRKTEKTTSITCSICLRTFISVYNLITHLKSHHTDVDVRKHKKNISETLSKFVEYHYCCRICQQQFEGIKELRTHVPTHKGKELFNCEVGNHMAS